MISVEAISKAVGEVKAKSKKRKFTQTIDLVVNLKELDMKKPENRLNEEVVLPNGRGREIKVGVIAEGELAVQAKKVADMVVSKLEMEELAKNKKFVKKLADSCEFFIAQADLMPLIGKYLGSVLGPRGKMPKPVPANAQIAPLIEKLKKTVRIRTKENPVIQIPVGNEKMEDKSIAENIEAVIKFMEEKLEKGILNIKSIYIKTTMGPIVKLEAQ